MSARLLADRVFKNTRKVRAVKGKTVANGDRGWP